jgi:capsular polysaccharide biosynthesis protein
MNLIDYARILIQRGWIAVLLAVIAGSAAFLFSQMVTPVYRSTQVILLVPSRSDLGLAEAAIRLINSRRAWLDSDLRAEAIIDELQLDFTPSYLRGQTTIQANRDNLSIQIDVDLPAPDAPSAAALINPIARAWGDQLIGYQEELNRETNREDRIRAQRQDEPRLAQLQPRPTIYAAIGAITGFFIGVVIILVLEYLESNVIRRRADVERSADLKVLAIVPRE